MSGEFNIRELDMKQRRYRLSQSRHERQRAVARFPIVCAQLAADMNKMLDYIESGGNSAEVQQHIDYIEEKIRDEYRKCFGAEIGDHAENQQELAR
jgi:hypothetical protein